MWKGVLCLCLELEYVNDTRAKEGCCYNVNMCLWCACVNDEMRETTDRWAPGFQDQRKKKERRRKNEN